MRNGENLRDELAEAIKIAEDAKKNISIVGARYNRKFNEFWGQLFKSGHQDSRFARQVFCRSYCKYSVIRILNSDNGLCLFIYK